MVVQYTGMLAENITCRIMIAAEGMTAHIDRRFAPNLKELIPVTPIPEVLVLAIGAGEFATLTGLTLISRSSHIDNEQQILNVARVVVGPAPFYKDGSIEGIRFVPTNELHAIYYTHHRSFGGLSSQDAALKQMRPETAILGRYQIDVLDNTRLEAARIIHGSTLVRMDIAVNSQHNIQGTKWSEQRRVSIGYEKGSKLTPAIADVQYVCAFMSMMLGKLIAPTEIIFGVKSPKRGETGDYRLYARFREPAPRMKFSDLNTGLVSPHDDREKYEVALASWFGRRKTWQKSIAFALDALDMGGRLDRARFLNATGWFEAIPTIYLNAPSSISKEDLDKAAGLATNFLHGSGHTGLGERIRNMMGNLNHASLGMRLKEAIRYLRGHFGPAVLPASAERDCRLIASIRGSYAHGDDPLLGGHANQVMEMMLLTEAICYLLTIASLGVEPVAPLGADHRLPLCLEKLALLARPRAQKPVQEH